MPHAFPGVVWFASMPKVHSLGPCNIIIKKIAECVQANVPSLLESGLPPPTHTWTRWSLPWLHSLFSVWKVFSAAHCMGTVSKRLKTCPECRCAAIVDPQQMLRSVWIDPCTQKSPYVHLTFRIISNISMQNEVSVQHILMVSVSTKQPWTQPASDPGVCPMILEGSSHGCKLLD